MSAGRVRVLVTAPLVLARDENGSVGYYYRGPAPVELTAAEAHRLAGDGFVQIIAGGSAPAPEPAAAPAPPAPAVDVDQDDDELDLAEPAPAPAPEPAVKRPAQVADKADWIDYAVARGLDREHAESRTKRELIAELS